MAEERGFMDVMRDVIEIVAPGLKDFGAEVGAEMERMGTQGAAELASALFNGAAYTPYGEGQQAVEVEAPQVQQERGGMEM
jgi:hypothetical protein